MPHRQVRRNARCFKALAERYDRRFVERDIVSPEDEPRPFAPVAQPTFEQTVEGIRKAKAIDKPRILAFGKTLAPQGGPPWPRRPKPARTA